VFLGQCYGLWWWIHGFLAGGAFCVAQLLVYWLALRS
jgi:hypothetical protein